MTTLEYFKGDELAASVFQSKYAQEGDTTPDDMHRRMAKEFAKIEEKYQEEEGIMWANNSVTHKRMKEGLSQYGLGRRDLTEEKIYELFKDFSWIVPQGSVMSSLGVTDKIASLSNCFVIGQPEDSYGGIMQKDEELVQLMKRRGGVGLDLSTLRPRSTKVTNAAGTSTGAASFMHRFSNSTREVAQEGRRGALMLSIDVRHPDVEAFATAKMDRTSVTGANISVLLRDDFMEAVKKDQVYMLRFPVSMEVKPGGEEALEIGKLYNYNNGFIKLIRAKELWNTFIKCAHASAEPGLMFVDQHWNYSPDGVYPQYRGVTTNPCGEIFMQPYDACRLLAINLYSYVGHPFTKDAYFDYNLFYEHCYEQQRLADNLVDLELACIDRIIEKILADQETEEVKQKELKLWRKIREVCASGRRTGCGITALGDMLAALGYLYDSPEALSLVERVMKTKFTAELDCTIDLAILRGPFEGWSHQLEYHYGKATNEFYSMLTKEFPEQAKRMANYGRRNVSWSTVAPTGTVSILTQTTSGLEPLFMAWYERFKKINPNDKDARVDRVDDVGDKWQKFFVLHPKFRSWCEYMEQGDLLKRLYDGSKEEDLKELFEMSPWYKSTANDIDWTNRVKLQSIIQRYTTHSISSTINLPSTVKVEEVADIYMAAYEKGLKGVTVYVDGSRSGVLVSTDQTKQEQGFSYKDAHKRPKSLDAKFHYFKYKEGYYTVYIGMIDNKPYEVFADVSDKIPESPKVDEGKIIKVSKGVYEYESGTLKSEQTFIDKNGVSTEEVIPARWFIMRNAEPEHETITRLISASLRHGTDVKFLVEQLQKTEGGLMSFSKALARILKLYIPDGVESTLTCQDCGSKSIIFEEGCSRCKSCGSSKCG